MRAFIRKTKCLNNFAVDGLCDSSLKRRCYYRSALERRLGRGKYHCSIKASLKAGIERRRPNLNSRGTDERDNRAKQYVR